jgi:hypothetical protein
MTRFENAADEVRLAEVIMSFDGRVLEFFGQGNQSRRIHVATIEKIEAADGRLTGSALQIKVRGESDTYYSLEGDDAQRAALDALLAKVEAARAAETGP